MQWTFILNFDANVLQNQVCMKKNREMRHLSKDEAAS